MTAFTDRTAAPDSEFAEVLAAIEAAPAAEEAFANVERVARAIAQTGYETVIDEDAWDVCFDEMERDDFRDYAVAAIVAIDSDATAALRRVLALAEELTGHGRALVERPDQMPAFHGRQVTMLAAAIRAAVAGAE